MVSKDVAPKKKRSVGKKKVAKKKVAKRKAPPRKKVVKKKVKARRKKQSIRRIPPLAQSIIDFAHSHKVPEGHMVGQDIVLMDWQIEWIIETFDPKIRVSLLSIARRGGKTAVVAIIMAAAIYGPLVVANALLLSASRSTEQAAIVYKYIFNMARLSGYSHMLVFRDSKKEIDCPRHGTTYKAVSADAKTQHGKSANILITDELGQVRGPTDDLYDTLSSGQGSYLEPKHLIISTRAPNDNDLFNILIDDAQSGLDPTTAVRVYEADEGCDLLDEEQWLKANPSLPYGVRDLGDLRRQALQATRIPSKEASFRNLILNQKVDPASSFITAGVWKQGAREVDDSIFTNPLVTVYGGLDLSARTDITSLVLTATKPGTKETHVKVFAWTPKDNLREKSATDRVPYDVWVKQGFIKAIPGKAIHYDHVAADIAQIIADYDVDEVAFDRWHIDQLQHEFDDIGAYINMVPFGQGYKDMSPAIDELESCILDDLLVHGGNPVLTSHISNVVITTDPTNARKMDKSKAVNKIDAAVALAMSLAVLKKTTSGDDVYTGLYASDESAKLAVL